MSSITQSLFQKIKSLIPDQFQRKSSDCYRGFVRICTAYCSIIHLGVHAYQAVGEQKKIKNVIARLTLKALRNNLPRSNSLLTIFNQETGSGKKVFLKALRINDFQGMGIFAVTCVIPGTSKPHYMLDNLGAATGKLPDKKPTTGDGEGGWIVIWSIIRA